MFKTQQKIVYTRLHV